MTDPRSTAIFPPKPLGQLLRPQKATFAVTGRHSV